MKKYGFSARERIKKRKDFQRILKSAKINQGNFARFYVLFREESGLRDLPNRLGLIVSKKIGPAVLRNRIKRLLREVYRLHKKKLKKNLDLVVMALPAIKNLEFHTLEKEMLSFYKKANILEED